MCWEPKQLYPDLWSTRSHPYNNFHDNSNRKPRLWIPFDRSRMQRRGRRTFRRMKLFDSAQGAFIKYHYFPRTHILTQQREISYEYAEKEKRKRKPPWFLFKNIHLWGRSRLGCCGLGTILVGDRQSTQLLLKGLHELRMSGPWLRSWTSLPT